MITILTTNDCVQCTYTKKKLDEVHVSYREINVSEDEQAKHLLRIAGITQMPVVMWSGFKMEHLRGLPCDSPQQRLG